MELTESHEYNYEQLLCKLISPFNYENICILDEKIRFWQENTIIIKKAFFLAIDKNCLFLVLYLHKKNLINSIDLNSYEIKKIACESPLIFNLLIKYYLSRFSKYFNFILDFASINNYLDTIKLILCYAQTYNISELYENAILCDNNEISDFLLKYDKFNFINKKLIHRKIEKIKNIKFPFNTKK